MRHWHLVEGIDLWTSVNSFVGQHVPQVNHLWLGEGAFLKTASQSFAVLVTGADSVNGLPAVAPLQRMSSR